jgi:hypothetical protein
MKNVKIDLNDLANPPDHQLSIVPREEPSEKGRRGSKLKKPTPRTSGE